MQPLGLVDTAIQTFNAPGDVVFNQPALIADPNYTYTPGTAAITIAEPGVYQASFHTTVATTDGTSIPAEATMALQLNGADVPGSSARQTFTSSDEVANVAITVPLAVTAPNAQLVVRVNTPNFILSDSSLTLFRLQ